MLSSARERASIPSAQSVPLARVVSASRSRASAGAGRLSAPGFVDRYNQAVPASDRDDVRQHPADWASARPTCGAQLETVVAGTEGPGPLRQLLDASDVLVSTAGPFVKIGPGGRGCGGGRGRGIPGLHR
jgi:hypothetical protein